MKAFFLLLSTLMAMACNNDDAKRINSHNLAVNFEMEVRNYNGEDLLDPSHPNAIDHESIKLYYVTDGVPVEVYDVNMDYPRNFLIYKDNEIGFYKIRITPNHANTGSSAETYIDWNTTDRDTIKCNFFFSQEATILKKVWYNNILKLNSESSTGLTFKIVK